MPNPAHQLAPDFEPDYDTADVEFDDAPSASYEESVDVEYEMPADPDYDDSAHADYELEVAEPPPRLVVAAEPAFAYEVGRAVLPLTHQQPRAIVWRGHLKERHPATGLMQRVPVYRLADGYWDCYREEELQVA